MLALALGRLLARRPVWQVDALVVVTGRAVRAAGVIAALLEASARAARIRRARRADRRHALAAVAQRGGLGAVAVAARILTDEAVARGHVGHLHLAALRADVAHAEHPRAGAAVGVGAVAELRRELLAVLVAAAAQALLAAHTAFAVAALTLVVLGAGRPVLARAHALARGIAEVAGGAVFVAVAALRAPLEAAAHVGEAVRFGVLVGERIAIVVDTVAPLGARPDLAAALAGGAVLTDGRAVAASADAARGLVERVTRLRGIAARGGVVAAAVRVARVDGARVDVVAAAVGGLDALTRGAAQVRAVEHAAIDALRAAAHLADAALGRRQHLDRADRVLAAAERLEADAAVRARVGAGRLAVERSAVGVDGAAQRVVAAVAAVIVAAEAAVTLHPERARRAILARARALVAALVTIAVVEVAGQPRGAVGVVVAGRGATRVALTRVVAAVDVFVRDVVAVVVAPIAALDVALRRVALGRRRADGGARALAAALGVGDGAPTRGRRVGLDRGRAALAGGVVRAALVVDAGVALAAVPEGPATANAAEAPAGDVGIDSDAIVLATIDVARLRPAVALGVAVARATGEHVAVHTHARAAEAAALEPGGAGPGDGAVEGAGAAVLAEQAAARRALVVARAGATARAGLDRDVGLLADLDDPIDLGVELERVAIVLLHLGTFVRDARDHDPARDERHLECAHAVPPISAALADSKRQTIGCR